MKEKNLGDRIKSIRKEIGYSQSEVVDKMQEKGIDMSRETLSKIETNNRSISAIELKVLSKILSVNIEDFFDKEEETENLLTLFRKKGEFSEQSLQEIEEVYDMLSIFILQEKIYNGEYKPKEYKPFWEEFTDEK